MGVCAINRFSSGMQDPQLVPAFSFAPKQLPFWLAFATMHYFKL